ncbi:Threonylcarbamoyladenosine tRNA methylthiotransferase MtaB [compost metagenome]
MPQVAVTTDVITGFPGETEAMFENGLRFMEGMHFADMHIFPYSKRTGTPAARMDGQIPEEEKNRRVGLLMELSSRMRLDYSRRFTGEILEVIPEMGSYEGDGDVELIGHSDNYLHIAFSGPKELAGRMVQVRMTEAGIPYCRGVRLKDAVPAGASR